jgi:hypothetical protein
VDSWGSRFVDSEDFAPPDLSRQGVIEPHVPVNALWRQSKTRPYSGR